MKTIAWIPPFWRRAIGAFLLVTFLLCSTATTEEPVPKLTARERDLISRWALVDPDPPPPGAAVSAPIPCWHHVDPKWAAFSSDSRRLASVAGQEFFLWKCPSGEQLLRWRLLGHEGPLVHVSISADFKTLATVDGPTNMIRVWDTETGRLIREFSGLPGQVQLSSDGQLLVAQEITPDGPKLAVWNVADGKRRWTLAGFDGSVTCAFSTDGRTLLSVDSKLAIRSWDVATGAQKGPQQELDAPKTGYTTAVFSPDGRLLALMPIEQHGARVFEVASGRAVFKLELAGGLPDRSPVDVLRFSADGTHLVIGGRYSEVAAWNMATGAREVDLPAQQKLLSVSPDFKWIATQKGYQIQLWDTADGSGLFPPAIRTYLRPPVARLAAEDPFRIAIHWADLTVNRRHGVPHPFRTPPLDGEYSQVQTLASMTFHISTPDGNNYALRAAFKGGDGSARSLIDMPSFFLTLDRSGLHAGAKRNQLHGAWTNEDLPDFDLPGEYKIAISGSLSLDPGEDVSFESGTATVERGVEGYLPLARIKEQAVSQLRMLLPDEKRKIHDDDSDTSSFPKEIIDGPHSERIVRLSIYGEEWNAYRYRVAVLPDGRVVEVTVADDFICVASGTSIDTPDGPRAIEELRVGDQVWGYDLAEQKRVLTAVKSIRHAVAGETIILGDQLRVTPEHPVYASGRWKLAGSVDAAELMLRPDGSRQPVRRCRQTQEEIDVYDLSVGEPHNFFASGWLVHNKSMGYSPGYFDPWRVFGRSRPKDEKRIYLAVEHVYDWNPDTEVLDISDVKTDDAGLAHVARLEKLKLLNLSGCPITDAGLAAIRGLRDLQSLTLDHTPTTSVALEHLSKLGTLESLQLRGTGVGDEGLEQLANLPCLAVLDLSETAVSDAGLAKLAGLAELTRLELSGARIDGSGLAPIGKLPKLAWLDLSKTSVGDEDLKHLARCRVLRRLDLSGTNVTGAGLKRLRRLAQLEEIYLDDTRVDDAGLAHLEQLPNLKVLSLMGSEVTGEGLKYVERLLTPHNALRIAPTRTGGGDLDRLKRFGRFGQWLALQIETHRAEMYAIDKMMHGPGGDAWTFRPLHYILARDSLGPAVTRSRDRLYDRPERTDESLRFQRNFERVVKVRCAEEDLQYLPSFEHLEELSFSQRKVPWESLEKLRGLPIRVLDLSDYRGTDDSLRRLPPLQLLEDLNLGGNPIGPAGIAHLKVLPKLKELRLGGMRADDAVAAAVADLAQLEVLGLQGRFEGQPITDAGAAHLARLVNLRELSLRSSALSPIGIRSLQPLVNLRSLRIEPYASRTRIARFGDAELAALADLSQLEELRIDHASVTDKGVDVLLKFERLETLELSRFHRMDSDKLHNQSLATLARLPRLRHLDLSGQAIDDDGLEVIAGMKELRSLRLSRCPIKGHGLHHLKKLENLNSLWLDLTALEGAWIDVLAEMRQVRELNLEKLKFETREIEQLKRMAWLENLYVGFSNLEGAPLRELQEALPRTNFRAPLQR